MLAAVHISSRYHVGAVLEEAREVFEPTVAPRDFDLDRDPLPRARRPQARPERSATSALPSRPEQREVAATFGTVVGQESRRTPGSTA